MYKIMRNTIPLLILGCFGASIAHAQIITSTSSPTIFINASSSVQDILNIATTTPFGASDQIPKIVQDILNMSTTTPLGAPRQIPKLPNPLVQPLSIVVTPASPSPGESVNVEAHVLTFDADRANFVWTVDGVSRSDLSGFGKNIFTFTAGNVGSGKRVSVRVEPTGEPSVSASQTIYITDLSLTWTAHTYTPKWYKGKALPVPNAKITIAAIPTFIIDDATIPANRLIYTWEIDGYRVLKGIGKQVLELKQPEQSWDTQTVLLNVQDASRRIQKEIRIGIASQQTHAVIYQTLPLGGIEFRRGTSVSPAIAPGVIDLQVEPFFFNKVSRYDLSYQWSVQNIIASSSPKNPFLLTLDAQQLPSSDVPISVFVRDTDTSVPSASGFIGIPIRQ